MCVCVCVCLGCKKKKLIKVFRRNILNIIFDGIFTFRRPIEVSVVTIEFSEIIPAN